MNQILITNFNKNTNNGDNYKLKKSKKKKLFTFQFSISILIVIILITFLIFYLINLLNKEKVSNSLISNYSVYKLYSNNSNSKEVIDNKLFGIIEIPKINIYYPIFSYIDEELLKISPCKFYGETPDKNSNLCIASHNYNNSLFFSNINLLNNDDIIYIYDNSGKKYTYTVFNKYEVKETDLSPIFNYDEKIKQLTLLTCNNLNSNRIIINAKQQESL